MAKAGEPAPPIRRHVWIEAEIIEEDETAGTTEVVLARFDRLSPTSLTITIGDSRYVIHDAILDEVRKLREG